MANDALKNKWQPILRYSKEFRAAQALVLAEEGVWVPFIRMAAHCGIETGYSGDKNSVSGPNNCCDNRCSQQCGTCCTSGKDCGPDCRAHGLFQIFWPPFGGVDWSRIYDPGYNSYLGAKVLARRFKQCGSWRGASAAFFAGSCVDIGTIDPNTGTDQAKYDQAMTDNMAELEQLGVGDETENPKVPPSNGSTNTSDGKPGDPKCIHILGQELCFDFGLDTEIPSATPVDIARAAFEQYFPRIAVLATAIVLLAIGVYATVYA